MDFLLKKLKGYRLRLLQDTLVLDEEDILVSDKDKAVQEYRAEHFKISINQAWVVLNKYYKLSDNTPAYQVAVILYPWFKIEYFQNKWCNRPTWITKADTSVKNMQSEYKVRYQAPAKVASKKEKS